MGICGEYCSLSLSACVSVCLCLCLHVSLSVSVPVDVSFYASAFDILHGLRTCAESCSRIAHPDLNIYTQLIAKANSVCPCVCLCVPACMYACLCLFVCMSVRVFVHVYVWACVCVSVIFFFCCSHTWSDIIYYIRSTRAKEGSMQSLLPII